MNTKTNLSGVVPDLSQVMSSAREYLSKGMAVEALQDLYVTFEKARDLTQQQEQDLHDLIATALYTFLEQKDAIPLVEEEELLDAHA